MTTGLDPATASAAAVVLAVALMVVAARGLARRTRLPHQVLLVVVGAAASFLPAMGHVALNPRLVFLGILPPLVYHAGLVTSPRELRANALPIGLGALGLVLVTTLSVAAIARAAAPALGWAGAFVLGAVVAPTDPVAATSLFSRLGVPPRVTTVLEGESLVNDGIALALFAIGLAAVARPTGLAGGIVTFLRVAGGGTAFGLVAGWLAARVRRPIRDPASQIVVSLLVPFAVYLPADALGLSGVLATLTTGLVLGQRPTAVGPAGHVRMAEFWQVLVFLLESVLFVLVGLQLRQFLAAVGGRPAGAVALVAGSTAAAVVVVRLLWWLAVPTLRWRPEGRLLDTGGVPPAERLVLGWSGLRGAISLAAALSVPSVVDGHRFPGRDLVVFTTFGVILVTLVGQGTTLPALAGRLGVCGSGLERQQRSLAERRCAEAALRLLDELAADDRIGDEDVPPLRARYERRIELAAADDDRGGRPHRQLPVPAVERQLLAVQHQTLRELHRHGQVGYAVVRAVRRELDLEHARLEG